MSDWVFGDVLRLKERSLGYQDIRLMFIGPHPPDEKGRDLVAAVYLVDSGYVRAHKGKCSTFYRDSYEPVDD